MGPTWFLSAPDGRHVGTMNLALRDTTLKRHWKTYHSVGEVGEMNRQDLFEDCYIWCDQGGCSHEIYAAIKNINLHYNVVIMRAMASQIISLTIVYSTVYSDANRRKHQSSASLALCEGNSPVTGEFSALRASNAENVSNWWRHYGVQLAYFLN